MPAFFEEASKLDCFPGWQRGHLRYVRDEGEINRPETSSGGSTF